ncbi:hypothetical protein MXD58_020305, partial [Frankia sp. AgKG'84/4]
MPMTGLTVADHDTTAVPASPDRAVAQADRTGPGRPGQVITGHFVDGVLVEGVRSGATPVHDPATGALIGYAGQAGTATVAS